MEKKYEFTNTDLYFKEMMLHQIRALKDFGNVKKGDLGGWIESEDNLSQEGNCWIHDNVKVCNHARVYDNAIIGGNVLITNSAKIHDTAFIYNRNKDRRMVICDNAEIYGATRINGSGHIRDNATIYGFTTITSRDFSMSELASIGSDEFYNKILINVDDLTISKNAKISGYVDIHEHILKVGKNALIKNSNDVIVSGFIGSRQDRTTFYKGSDGSIYASVGCFNGRLDELVEAVNNTHKKNYIYRNEYLITIDYAKKMFDMYTTAKKVGDEEDVSYEKEV